MKHESIIVVYDSCQAVAEEIADKLGAEIVSVQSMNARQIENCHSFVLAVEFQSDGHLTSHWQYACQTFCGINLEGKNMAVLVALGNRHDHDTATKLFCSKLRKSKAHIIGDQPFPEDSGWNVDRSMSSSSNPLENWICAISPNL